MEKSLHFEHFLSYLFHFKLFIELCLESITNDYYKIFLRKKKIICKTQMGDRSKVLRREKMLSKLFI